MLGEENEVLETYWNCEQKAQKIQKWIYLYLCSELTVYSTCLLISFYCIYSGNYDTSTWTTTYNLVIPFDTDNFWRWYIMWFVRFNMGMTYTAVTTSATSYFVGCCLYISAMCDHFGFIMRSTAEDVERLEHVEQSFKRDTLTRNLKKKLSQAIEIHVKIFE